MTIRTRLLLAWLGVVALLAFVAILSANRMNALRDIAFEQRGRHAEAFLDLGRLQVELAELDRFLRAYVATGEPAMRDAMRRAIIASGEQAERIAAAGYEAPTEMTRASLERLALALDTVQLLMERGAIEAATAHFESSRPLLERVRESLTPVARAIDEHSRADLLDAHRISESGARGTLFAILASLILALALGLATTSWLIRPIRRLGNAMAAVASGRLGPEPDLPYRRRDEIGDLARSFRAMAAQLADADRMRAEFLGMASHDLKTPLNVIVGYAELLEDGFYGEASPEQREVLGAIREQAFRVTHQVDQLLDASRIEAGGLEIHKQVVDPYRLFEGIERAFRGVAARKAIQLDIDVHPSVPSVIVADADRLRDQVLGNLLTNAFKFTPDGGNVHVRVWTDDHDLCIDVADTGPGIDRDQLSRIFSKFYQVGPDTRGVGLGLAIAKEVIAQHGGRVGVGSEPGRGTTFHVRLPV